MGAASSLRRAGPDPGITRLTKLLGGRAVLGRNVRTTEDLERLLDDGISMDALEGLARTFGLPADRVFDRVHDSNMSKLGNDGKPVRRDDGKVMKGPNYHPPSLDDLIDHIPVPAKDVA